MKIKIILLLILSVLLIQNCAPKKRLKTASIASIYQKTGPDGAVTSEKKHTVTLSHYTEIEMAYGKTIFRMIVLNRGKEPIKISNENISVMFKKKEEYGSQIEIKIQLLHDFMDDLEKAYFFAEYVGIKEILIKIRWLLERLLKGLSESQSEAALTNLGESVDKYLRKIVLELVEEVRSKRNEFGQLKESVPQIFIRPQTIMPDDAYLGLIVCDTMFMRQETEGNFRVVVSIDGEDHEFILSRSYE